MIRLVESKKIQSIIKQATRDFVKTISLIETERSISVDKGLLYLK